MMPEEKKPAPNEPPAPTYVDPETGETKPQPIDPETGVPVNPANLGLGAFGAKK